MTQTAMDTTGDADGIDESAAYGIPARDRSNGSAAGAVDIEATAIARDVLAGRMEQGPALVRLAQLVLSVDVVSPVCRAHYQKFCGQRVQLMLDLANEMSALLMRLIVSGDKINLARIAGGESLMGCVRQLARSKQVRTTVQRTIVRQQKIADTVYTGEHGEVVGGRAVGDFAAVFQDRASVNGPLSMLSDPSLVHDMADGQRTLEVFSALAEGSKPARDGEVSDAQVRTGAAAIFAEYGFPRPARVTDPETQTRIKAMLTRQDTAHRTLTSAIGGGELDDEQDRILDLFEGYRHSHLTKLLDMDPRVAHLIALSAVHRRPVPHHGVYVEMTRRLRQLLPQTREGRSLAADLTRSFIAWESDIPNDSSAGATFAQSQARIAADKSRWGADLGAALRLGGAPLGRTAEAVQDRLATIFRDAEIDEAEIRDAALAQAALARSTGTAPCSMSATEVAVREAVSMIFAVDEADVVLQHPSADSGVSADMLIREHMLALDLAVAWRPRVMKRAERAELLRDLGFTVIRVGHPGSKTKPDIAVAKEATAQEIAAAICDGIHRVLEQRAA